VTSRSGSEFFHIAPAFDSAVEVLVGGLMTASFTLEGIIPAAYGRSYRAMRALGPATAIAFVILLAGDGAEALMRHENDVPAVTGWWLLLHAAVFVLVAPYRVRLYEVMWDVGPPSIPKPGARRRAILNVVALDLLLFLGGAAWLWNLHDRLGIPVLLLLGLLVPSWWICIRLTLAGPALALGALGVFPLSLSGAVSATKGRVWDITFAGLLVGAVLLPVLLAIIAATLWLQAAVVKSALVKPALMSPVNILSLVTSIAVQAELYRRMGLPSASHADRAPA